MAPQGAGCLALGVHGSAPAEVQEAAKAEHFSLPGMCSQTCNDCADELYSRMFRNVPPQVLGKLWKAKKISGSASKNIS